MMLSAFSLLTFEMPEPFLVGYIQAMVFIKKFILGAGASEALMAAKVLMEAQKVAGKESIAVEAFGRALLQLPTIICDNAGLDSAELISHIRAEHANGNHRMGIGINFEFVFRN